MASLTEFAFQYRGSGSLPPALLAVPLVLNPQQGFASTKRSVWSMQGPNPNPRVVHDGEVPDPVAPALDDSDDSLHRDRRVRDRKAE